MNTTAVRHSIHRKVSMLSKGGSTANRRKRRRRPRRRRLRVAPFYQKCVRRWTVKIESLIKLSFLVCELKLVFQFLCKSQIQEVMGPESRGKIKFLRFGSGKVNFGKLTSVVGR